MADLEQEVEKTVNKATKGKAGARRRGREGETKVRKAARKLT